MGMTNKDLWRLAIQSRLLTADQGKLLARKFAQIRGSNVDDPRLLGEWLVSENAISRYQMKVLLAGRSGPFNYGDYQVYDRVSDGRLAGMFRAIHLPTRHPVLLAFLSPEVAKSDRRWAAVAAQTQAWGRTAHPNLARVYEPVDLKTHRLVVLEDIRGQSLESVLAAGLPHSTEASLWVQQAAMALSHLQRAQMAHGDVRPATLWLDLQGQVKLFVDPREPRTAPAVQQPDATGWLLERADYLAPEFSNGRKLPDAQTDIYALGASLYQLLSGRPPFPGGDVAQKMQRHANEAVQPIGPSVPPELAQLVNYMMAKDREVRYQEAEHVAEQLRPFAAAAPSTPTPPPTLTPYLQHIKQKQAELAAAEAAARPTPIVTDSASASGAEELEGMGAPSSVRRRPKKQDKTVLAVSGVCAAAAAIIAILVIANADRGDQPVVQEDSGNGASVTNVSGAGKDAESEIQSSRDPDQSLNANQPPAAAVEDAPTAAPLVADDGESLWGSPTLGEPISLDYVPMGGIAYLSARPADLLQTEDGARAWKALGPGFAEMQEAWEKRAGLQPVDLESVLVTFHNAGDAFPRPSYVVRLTTPRPKSELVAAWQAEAVDDSYWKASADCFYIPSTQQDDSVRVFTMGAEEDIRDVAERKGTPPLVRSAFADLLLVSDRDRHVTLLFTPYDASNRFFHAGRDFYFGNGEKARKPLEWFLGEELKAVAASMHVTSSHAYFELRLANSLDAPSYDIAKRVQQRIEGIQSRMEAYMARLTPPDYWKTFTFRFPSMFRFLHRQSRVQVDQGMAVVNAVLPSVAAHNLLFGCEMALASKPGTLVAAAPADPAAAPPKDVQALLQRKMSLSFDQLSLEFAMAQVQNDAIENLKPQFDFSIKIIGTDLQLNGITRNQQIKDFEESETSIAEILTALVMKANPVTTVETPDEVDQKLLWVLAPDKSGVLITTRDAATKKNYTLPKPFQPQQPAE